MMERKFKSLTDSKPVDLVPYLKEKLAEAEDINIYIGCDSQNHGNNTIYASVIVLHYGTRGGHVLYSREKVSRIRDSFTRLWKEVETSLEVAQFLTENGIQRAKYIDIDLNPDPKFRSNQVLRAALGYVESMGYEARCKPYAISASYVADKLCK
jgi:predicted RNase H-related nuclease YkuK (DUF458 family)